MRWRRSQLEQKGSSISQLSPSPKVKVAVRCCMAEPQLGQGCSTGAFRDSVVRKFFIDCLRDSSGNIAPPANRESFPAQEAADGQQVLCVVLCLLYSFFVTRRAPQDLRIGWSIEDHFPPRARSSQPTVQRHSMSHAKQFVS